MRNRTALLLALILSCAASGTHAAGRQVPEGQGAEGFLQNFQGPIQCVKQNASIDCDLLNGEQVAIVGLRRALIVVKEEPCVPNLQTVTAFLSVNPPQTAFGASAPRSAPAATP